MIAKATVLIFLPLKLLSNSGVTQLKKQFRKYLTRGSDKLEVWL